MHKQTPLPTPTPKLRDSRAPKLGKRRASKKKGGRKVVQEPLLPFFPDNRTLVCSGKGGGPLFSEQVGPYLHPPPEDEA